MLVHVQEKRVGYKLCLLITNFCAKKRAARWVTREIARLVESLIKGELTLLKF